MSRRVADTWVAAVVRYAVGQGAYFRGDYQAARSYLEEALPLLETVGDVLLLPCGLATLGGIDLAQGDYPQARARLEEALVRQTNDPRATALVASGLGDVARCQGDYTRAEAVYNVWKFSGERMRHSLTSQKRQRE